MKTIVILICIVAVLLAGCAKNPNAISPTYVSPMIYESYDCNQIQAEMLRVNHRLMDVAGIQRDERTKDQVALGVGLVLFWPAIFFMIGDDKKEEIANLKGHAEALEQASISKRCHALMDEIRTARGNEID